MLNDEIKHSEYNERYAIWHKRIKNISRIAAYID
jgi:hypothetical protein